MKREGTERSRGMGGGLRGLRAGPGASIGPGAPQASSPHTGSGGRTWRAGEEAAFPG